MADALSQVAKARPEDPIRYVANYLHSLSGDKDPLSQDEYRQQQSQNGRRDAEVSNGVGSDGGQSTDDSAADPHHQTQPQTNGGGGGAASYTDRRETQAAWATEPSSTSSSIGLPPSVSQAASITGGQTEAAGGRYRSVSLNRRGQSPDGTTGRQRRRRTKSFSRHTEETVTSMQRRRSRNPDKMSTTSSNNTSVASKGSRKSTTTFSKRLPSVALTPDEYKVKRGFKLPPMESPPSSTNSSGSRNGGFSRSDPSSLNSRGKYGFYRPTNRPLPLADQPDQSFDMQKHRKKTEKMLNHRVR